VGSQDQLFFFFLCPWQQHSVQGHITLGGIYTMDGDHRTSTITFFKQLQTLRFPPKPSRSPREKNAANKSNLDFSFHSHHPSHSHHRVKPPKMIKCYNKDLAYLPCQTLCFCGISWSTNRFKSQQWDGLSVETKEGRKQNLKISQ
jgi:hypothetical protein